MPLFPGEAVLATYAADAQAQQRLARLQLVPVFGILLVIMGPFAVLAAVSGGNPAFSLFFLLPLILVLVAFLVASRGNRSRRPTVAYLTNRRVITVRSGRNASSATIGLENLGGVQLGKSSWAARRAGVSWVYLLPMGTTNPLIRAGRVQMPAPGVVWVPALDVAVANDFRRRVLVEANRVQLQLGYPQPISVAEI